MSDLEWFVKYGSVGEFWLAPESHALKCEAPTLTLPELRALWRSRKGDKVSDEALKWLAEIKKIFRDDESRAVLISHKEAE